MGKIPKKSSPKDPNPKEWAERITRTYKDPGEIIDIVVKSPHIPKSIKDQISEALDVKRLLEEKAREREKVNERLKQELITGAYQAQRERVSG